MRPAREALSADFVPPHLRCSRTGVVLRRAVRSSGAVIRAGGSAGAGRLSGRRNMAFTKDDALRLLREYNQGEFHLRHAHIVGGVMRWYAEQLGYGDEADFWEIVGLLHDLDFEKYPDQHCIKEQEIMRERGVDERIIHAAASHGYQITVDIAPEHEMEKVLYAVDELTGLIGATAVMRPSKSVSDLEVKSVRKKYKDKKFAAGCSREVIERGAAMLGWELDDLIGRTILAMRSCESSCENV